MKYLAAAALALLLVGCTSIDSGNSASGQPARWSEYLSTPFQERVFQAPAEVLAELHRDNLATQAKYSFSKKEEAVPLAVSAGSRISQFARETLAALDPGVRKLTERVLFGVFPVKNIVKATGMCVPTGGGYYVLIEDEPSTYGIKKAGQADFTYYTYDLDREEFADKNGALLVFHSEADGKSMRDRYRDLTRKGINGTIAHEIGHAVHFILARGGGGSVAYVPREYFDLSWELQDGRVISRFEEQGKRLEALSQEATWNPEKTNAIMNETSFVNRRSFQDPAEDFATAFEQYILWRSNLEDAALVPNCTTAARFAQKKAYFDRIFGR